MIPKNTDLADKAYLNKGYLGNKNAKKDNPKTETITFRCTAEDKELWLNYAQKRGYSKRGGVARIIIGLLNSLK